MIFLFSGLGFFISDLGLMNNLCWFVLIYLIGAYIRLYDFEKLSAKAIKIFSIIGYLGFIVIACTITYMSKYNSSIFRFVNKISSMNSIIVLVEAVLIFMAFKNLEIKNSRVINVLGKSSIGVYLLQDSIFRDEFWKCICLVESFYFVNLWVLVLHIAGCASGIFWTGSIVEIIRVKVVEKIGVNNKYL